MSVTSGLSNASVVWHSPDLQLGSHAFCYGPAQYDGLSHTHREYNVVTCLTGTIAIHLAGEDRILLPGQTLVVNPDVLHRCSFGITGGTSSGVTVLVAPQLLKAVWDQMHGSSATCTLPLFETALHQPELTETACKIAEECSQMKTGFGLFIELLAKQMLIQLLRMWPKEQISETDRDFRPQLPWLYMHRATEYMNAYGKGQFRLSELCDEVGLSTSRFIPLFKSSAGLNPHTYYNRLLVMKAQRLLGVERCSTKEVAYSLGFKNVSHFCSLYHKLTGTSPQSLQS